jgi:hypothetical protein
MSQPEQSPDPQAAWTRGILEWDPKAGPFTCINKPECHIGGLIVGKELVCHFGDDKPYYPSEGEPPSPANIVRMCACWNKLAEHDDLEAVEVVPKGTLQELEELKAVYSQMCARLQACVQKHQIGLGGEKLDVLVTKEIDNMRIAIQEALSDLNCMRCLEASDTQLKRAALHKLKPHSLRP